MIMSNYFVILIFGFACVSKASTSICPYDVQACTCYGGGALYCYNLQTLPPLVTGSNVTKIVDLYLSGRNITSILDNSLPPGLLHIDLYIRDLNNISDDAFLTSATTLKVLTIANSKLQGLPSALLKLTNLTGLDLNNANIEFWDNAILQHIATSVTSLSLRSVGLSAWPSWFSLFHSLTAFDLSYNNLTSIPDDAFVHLTNTLTYVALRNTRLTQVPSALATLSSVTSLDLSENNIINVGGRPGIEQLTSFPLSSTLFSLHLESVGLTVAPKLANMTQLTMLYLNTNQLSDLSADSVPLPVISLELRENKFTSVPAAVASLFRLSSLDLSYNQITEISFDIFPVSLTILDLSDNKITKITDSFSTNVSTLNILFLEDNPISTISPSAFKNLIELRNLYLRSTSLTQIPLALTSLTKLVSLNLPTTVTCTCPLPPALYQWYQLYNGRLNNLGYCNNNLNIVNYLNHLC